MKRMSRRNKKMLLLQVCQSMLRLLHTLTEGTKAVLLWKNMQIYDSGLHEEKSHKTFNNITSFTAHIKTGTSDNVGACFTDVVQHNVSLC